MVLVIICRKCHKANDTYKEAEFDYWQWFDATAYDLWCGDGDELLDKYALNRQYDIVFASNVLNVQSSRKMLLETLNQIKSALNGNGEFICNYPVSPRKMEMDSSEIEEILISVFPNVTRVGGTKKAPIWRAN